MRVLYFAGVGALVAVRAVAVALRGRADADAPQPAPPITRSVDHKLGLWQQSTQATASNSHSPISNAEIGASSEKPRLIQAREYNDFTRARLPMEPPTVRRFSVEITEGEGAPDGYHRRFFSVNGKMPGDAIHVNENDHVEVQVTNALPNETISIHHHGMALIDTVSRLNTVLY